MDTSAPPDCPTFDDAVGDELLPLVLQHLALEDLCRVQRVCRRLRDAVATAQCVWQRLYFSTWPPPDLAGSKPPEGQTEPAQQQTQQQQGQTEQQTLQQQQQHQEQQLSLQPQEPQDQSGHLPRFTGQLQGLTDLPPPQQQAQQGSRSSSTAGPSPSGPGPALPSAPGASSSSSQRKRRREAEPNVRAAAAMAGATTARAAGVPEVDWRDLFKATFVERTLRERLMRQARRLQAESTLQMLQLEVYRLEQALRRERRLLPALQAELAALQRARQQAATAALAQTFWQPVAVQRAHGVVTDQAPQNAETREHDLQQRLAVSQLEIRMLEAALAAKRRHVAEATHKLQAMRP